MNDIPLYAHDDGKLHAAPQVPESTPRFVHFVTIRLEYVNDGRTPWKRRGRCTCGWQCFSWDPFRPILLADEHARQANRRDAR